jgi:hypothetical protein
MVDDYRASIGFIGDKMKDTRTWAGPLESLPEWANEEE